MRKFEIQLVLMAMPVSFLAFVSGLNKLLEQGNGFNDQVFVWSACALFCIISTFVLSITNKD